MAEHRQIGVVGELWRFPVKSMAGERLEAVDLTNGGLIGDRAYALVEAETGDVVRAKNVADYPGMLDVSASYAEPPEAGRKLPALWIRLPDGREVSSQDGGADAALSDLFGRRVRLEPSAPEDFAIDQHASEVESDAPAGRRYAAHRQKSTAPLFAKSGVPAPQSAAGFFDLYPLSLVTTSTFQRLRAVQPESRFDNRRFRMNLVVETDEEGFVENGWVGSSFELGREGRVRVAMLDPRCVMTTLAQGELPEDTSVLAAIVQHNRLRIGDMNPLPCAGVYAVVEAGGRLGVGDPVSALSVP